MANKLTAQEFAAKVRAKYPGEYDSLSDQELTQRVLKKYPEYGPHVDLETVTPKTQFEKDREPGAQKGFLGTLWEDLKGMAIPSGGQNPYPGMGIEQKVAAANEAVREDDARKASGRSLPYRMLAPVAQSIGVNVPGMEEAADKGDAAGVVGHATAAAIPAATSLAINVGGERAAKGLRNAGAGVLNKTVGTLKGDFAHGANPGMAYLEGGGGPALTMSGLAKQAETINQGAGRGLGEAYDNSKALIPVDTVREAISGPVEKLRTLQSGPGGTGVSPSLDNYAIQFEPTLKRSEARGGFTPRQLFDELKKPISKNTNWHDQTQFDLNKVRQQNTGAIGGILTDTVPGTEDLNRIYQGTDWFAKRADYRANTGQVPLSQISRKLAELAAGGGVGIMTGHEYAIPAAVAALDSVPGKSTLGFGAYHAGRALDAIPASLPLAISRPAANGSSVAKQKPNDESDNE